MSTYAPRPAQYGNRALASDLQADFDRRARNVAGTARDLGLTVHQVEALRYGGKGRADIVERVEAHLRGKK